MNIDLFLTTIAILILGIIFIKTLRKILTIVLCIIFIFGIYITFFTYEGALKFGLFVETNKISSYKVEFTNLETTLSEKYYQIDDNQYFHDQEIKYLICKHYGPTIICEKYENNE